MAKDRKKVQHIHSSIVDKQPTASSLEVGEIAVNNAASKEFLSIKNSNDEVVRFSTDEQLITWTEKKEVIPYSGTVDNVHLDTNRSNIEIKLNQVAASNTVKSDIVNGSTDIDGNPVNPSSDGGLTNGAGFAIDMSLYAMQGANPSFSSITVTNRSDLNGTNLLTGNNTVSGTNSVVGTNTINGTTNISGTRLDVTTTETHIKSCNKVTLESKNLIFTNGDCGEGEMTIETDDLCLVGEDKMNIYGRETNVGIDCDGTASAVTTNVYGTTTNVGADDLNVGAGSFDITAATETGYIGSATNVIGTNNTTISGNTVLKVSGTTTETKVDSVIETNLADKKESTSGNSYNDVKLNYSGTTGGTTTEVKVGNITENHSGTTTETKAGDVTENNLSNKTENTSGNVVISTTGTTTEAKGGAVIENNNSTKTETTVGNKIENNNANYTVNTTGVTELTSTGNTNIHSNANICETADVKATLYGAAQTNVGLNCEENDASTSTNVYGDTINASGDTFNINETTSVNINAPGTTLSGTNLTINEANTEINSCGKLQITTNDFQLSQCDGGSGSAEFEFCSGFTIDSNDIKLQQCGTDGSITIKEKNATISGTNLTINESSAKTDVNTATTNITAATTTIGTANTTVTNATTNVTASTTTISTANTTVTSAKTDINTATTNVTAATTTIGTANAAINTANTTVVSANTDVNTATTNITAATTTISTANTTVTSAKTDINTATTNVTAATTTIGTANTTVNVANTNISAATTNITTLNEKITDAEISAKTASVSGNTLAITEATSTIVTSPTTTFNGTNFTVSGNSTEIHSCGQVLIETDNYILRQCSGGGGQPSSGGSAEFDFCDGYKIKSNNVEIEQCGNDGSITIKENNTTISGTNLTIKESSAKTDVNAATTNITAATTTITTLNEKITDAEISANTASVSGNTLAITEATSTTIKSPATTISGTSLTVNESNVDVTACTEYKVDSNAITLEECGTGGSITIKEAKTDISGSTFNVTATTNINGGTSITGGTSISGNTSITGTTNINGNTNITGNTYISGPITIGTQCSGLTSTTISDSFCELLSRGVVTIEEDHNPSDTSLAAVYTFYQNGHKITNSAGTVVEIEVAKDKVLKSAEVVQNTSGEWVIRLTWITYDPDTQTSTETTTDIQASELVKDIEYVNTSSITGEIWYDSASGNQKISADTTVIIKNADGTGTSRFSKGSGTHTLNSYTLNSTSGDVKSTAANTNWTYDPFNSKKDIVVPTDASHINRKTVSWSYGDVKSASGSSYDPGDGTVNTTGSSRTMSFVIPKNLKDLNNDLSNLTWGSGATNVSQSPYNGSTAKSITIPSDAKHIAHKTVSWTYGSVTGATGATYDPADGTVNDTASTRTMSFTIPKNLKDLNNDLSNLKFTTGTTNVSQSPYNGSAEKTITIPSCVSHLDRHKITFQSGSTSSFNSQTYDPGNDCANSAETINIPTDASHINNRSVSWSYGSVCDATGGSYNPGQASGGSFVIPKTISDVTCGNVVNESGCLSIGKDVCVDGKVTASQGFFQSSDINVKENVEKPDNSKIVAAIRVPIVKFNYKDDESKRDIYGVIAQEVEKLGLDEVVYTDEKGKKSVDYTSLSMLKIAFLENENRILRNNLDEIYGRLKKLEEMNKD